MVLETTFSNTGADFGTSWFFWLRLHKAQVANGSFRRCKGCFIIKVLGVLRGYGRRWCRGGCVELGAPGFNKGFWYITRKIDIEAANDGLEDDVHFPRVLFSGSMLIFRTVSGLYLVCPFIPVLTSVHPRMFCFVGPNQRCKLSCDS